jgi:hypothetical protein
MVLIAYFAGAAINIYLLVYVVRLLRFKVGVWSPYSVEPQLESMAHDFANIFKWMGPIVVLNLALLSLGSVAMLLLHLFNYSIQGWSS